MSAVTVRDLAAADEERWRELWAAYLTFYDHQLPEQVTSATFRRLLDGSDGMAAIVAEVDRRVVGFAHTVTHAGTWTVAPRCYLEDLFVDPAHRGDGVGRSLVETVRDRARGAGADELYWITQTGNVTARRLYDRVATLVDFVRYEVDLT